MSKEIVEIGEEEMGLGSVDMSLGTMVGTDAPPEEIQDEDPGEDEQRDKRVFSKEYSNTASFSDQYVKCPGTYYEGPTMAVFLDLSKPTDMVAYNGLLKRAHPPTAPQILISSNVPQYSSEKASWITLVHYVEIWYKKLITEGR